MKNLNNYFVLFVTCFFALSEQSAAYTFTSDDCSQTAVARAITAASSGDTVYVPAGNCNWATPLTITKGIILHGNGVGKTNITYSGSSTNNTGYLVTYAPSDYSKNTPFEMSGFSFNCGNKIGWLTLGKTQTASFVIQTKIRVHHNSVTGTSGTTSPNVTGWGLILNHCDFYGLVDHNTFTDIGGTYVIKTQQNGGTENWFWSTSPQNIFVPGTSNYMYFEDNTFSFVAGGDVEAMLAEAAFNGRYVIRYNTIDVGNLPFYGGLMELHGHPSGMGGSFGAEIYGNKITNQNGGGYFINFRGGKSFVFFNSYSSNNNCTYFGSASGPGTCPTVSPELQIVHDTYLWGNRKNLNGSLMAFAPMSGGLVCNGLTDIPTPGRDMISEASSPAHVSCGTLASLPATCTTGDGYWVTTQSCSDLTGMVGASPITAISGTLYKCTSTNTWTPFYTPYDYPHPLRSSTALNPRVLLNTTTTTVP